MPVDQSPLGAWYCLCKNSQTMDLLPWTCVISISALNQSLDISPKSRVRPRATQQGCAKGGGTSPCQRSYHRKKFRRKADNKTKKNWDMISGIRNFGSSLYLILIFSIVQHYQDKSLPFLHFELSVLPILSSFLIWGL